MVSGTNYAIITVLLTVLLLIFVLSCLGISGLAMGFGALFVILTTLGKSYSGLVFSFLLHPLSRYVPCMTCDCTVFRITLFVHFVG